MAEAVLCGCHSDVSEQVESKVSWERASNPALLHLTHSLPLSADHPTFHF